MTKQTRSEVQAEAMKQAIAMLDYEAKVLTVGARENVLGSKPAAAPIRAVAKPEKGAR